MAQIVKEIVEVSSEIDYWFFRTDGGNYFETFLDHDFIAIGWNNITLADIRDKTILEVKSKIERVEVMPEESRSIKHKVSDIYNKVSRFDQFKKGDIIVIPSVNSQLLAFGEIIDEKAYQAKSGVNGCQYEKRRLVKWLTPGIPLKDLDPTFDKMRRGWHTVINVNAFDYYIDSVIHSVYIKDGNSHFVLKVQQRDDINLKDLAEVLLGLQNLMDVVNQEFQLGENISESTIKIYLQSPGLFNIKNSGLALLLTAMVLGSSSCSTTDQSADTQRKVEKIKTVNANDIDSLSDKMQKMRIQF
ncbi:hypothetical protein SAMN04487898_11346 [Pedobacter sp. ok626]|uniref:hypothetical protein n=1 Tax=Pedobacter sp. ok626 TaxID=1761882 RepID=UPI0008923788|nr:hypothetical protein [Pedobacter sp. ok626]SDK92833.1 hypothetical protein SAMN04487898_11346 [Pedobacter sp. ok626]